MNENLENTIALTGAGALGYGAYKTDGFKNVRDRASVLMNNMANTVESNQLFKSRQAAIAAQELKRASAQKIASRAIAAASILGTIGAGNSLYRSVAATKDTVAANKSNINNIFSNVSSATGAVKDMAANAGAGSRKIFDNLVSASDTVVEAAKDTKTGVGSIVDNAIGASKNVADTTGSVASGAKSVAGVMSKGSSLAGIVKMVNGVARPMFRK